MQIVHPSRRGSREIEHIGSAYGDAEVEPLKAAARRRLAAGQDELDLGMPPDASGVPVRLRPCGWGHLRDTLANGYAVRG